jgi:hypothetical protein
MDLNGKASTTIAVISITPEMFAIHDEYPSGATESRLEPLTSCIHRFRET